MNTVLNPRTNISAFRELLTLLTRHRHLTLEMARREISDRYTGQIFGLFWTIGHPLILMAVYVFVFSVVFKVKIDTAGIAIPLNYTTYILAGLIPWLAFQESMAKASTVILNNASIVKQIVFPLEVLPVKGVLSTIITEIVFFFILIVYVLATIHVLPWTYVLLPVLILLQFLAMTGVCYFLSATGVFLRDTKDFVQIFSIAGIYLLPAFYPPEAVPDVFRLLLYFNPFSYFIWCFQDVLYFGSINHPWAWIVFAVLSLGVFVSGYRYFRKLKPIFGNVL